jgi:hypothetical protein
MIISLSREYLGREDQKNRNMYRNKIAEINRIELIPLFLLRARVSSIREHEFLELSSNYSIGTGLVKKKKKKKKRKKVK